MSAADLRVWAGARKVAPPRQVGGTLGGPLRIPGASRKGNDKLFFFLQYEYRPSTDPQSTRYYTVPTLAQRNGDFNRSVGNARGDLYPASRIIDPLTGQPFPGGIIGVVSIPIARVARRVLEVVVGVQLLVAGIVIGRAVEVLGAALGDDVDDAGRPLSILGLVVVEEDLHLGHGVQWRAFVRASNYGTHNEGPNSAVNRYPWDPDADIDYVLGARNWGGTVTWVASSTLVGELTAGYAAWTEEQHYPEGWLGRQQKSKIGVNLPQRFPAQNPLDVIPALDFGTANIG